MPVDGRPVGTGIHATAVAISGAGLLILGPSGAGKSRLALALIAASSRRQPIRLVGDDRILLSYGDHGWMARPHPRIEGFIACRGRGIFASPFVAQVPVSGFVALGGLSGPTTLNIDLAQNFPCLAAVHSDEINADLVLRWWRGACTTPAMKSSSSM